MNELRSIKTRLDKNADDLTALERLLRDFKGHILWPVNYGNTHWALIHLDAEGRATYLDSLVRDGKLLSDLGVKARNVPLVVEIVQW